MRRLRFLIYAYLIIGMGFGLALFGWGALIAAMAEPETPIFITNLGQAALDGLIRIANWAPSLMLDVMIGSKSFFDWLLYP